MFEKSKQAMLTHNTPHIMLTLRDRLIMQVGTFHSHAFSSVCVCVCVCVNELHIVDTACMYVSMYVFQEKHPIHRHCQV